MLNKIGGAKLVDMGAEIYTDIPEFRKFLATERMIQGIAARGDFHAAHVAIPSTLTDEQDLDLSQRHPFVGGARQGKRKQRERMASI